MVHQVLKHAGVFMLAAYGKIASTGVLANQLSAYTLLLRQAPHWSSKFCTIRIVIAEDTCSSARRPPANTEAPLWQRRRGVRPSAARTNMRPVIPQRGVTWNATLAMQARRLSGSTASTSSASRHGGPHRRRPAWRAVGENGEDFIELTYSAEVMPPEGAEYSFFRPCLHKPRRRCTNTDEWTSLSVNKSV